MIELSPGLGLDDPAAPPAEVITGRQPWEWPVDLDLVGERLHHAVWANAVDGRGDGRGGGGRRWPSPWAPSRPAAPTGDVTLPGGEPAVCDGGPLDAALAGRLGVAVVHRIVARARGRCGRSARAIPPASRWPPTSWRPWASPPAAARVIAPAGSGKTRVLTERARLLLRGWGLPEGSVALIAYNVRAAAEMKERLSDVAGVRVRTLNALGLRLLREPVDDRGDRGPRRLLGGLVNFPRRAESDPAAPWIEALSRLRLGLAHPGAGRGRAARRRPTSTAWPAATGPSWAIGGSSTSTSRSSAPSSACSPTRRSGPASQRFARVLLVDEFQDLTPAHLLLIRLLSGPAGAVFAVGDDDQTIYGYAGATPRWLVDFGTWFPGAATHPLEVNYRCPPPVVTAASNLLTRNARAGRQG